MPTFPLDLHSLKLQKQVDDIVGKGQHHKGGNIIYFWWYLVLWNIVNNSRPTMTNKGGHGCQHILYISAVIRI